MSVGLVRSIVTGIETRWPRATRDGEWKLNHRLFRNIPDTKQEHDNAAPNTNPSHSYHHLLHASYISYDRTYNLVQPPAQKQPVAQDGRQPPQITATSSSPPSAIIAIPISETDSHFSLLAHQWGALWTPQRILDVPNGIKYTAGMATIYIGELRQRRQGPQSANILSPGVVVSISISAGAGDDDTLPNDPDFPPFDDDIDFEPAQNDIRELWKEIKRDIDFGKSEVREFMQIAQNFDGNKEGERQAAARMWCEALRMRG